MRITVFALLLLTTANSLVNVIIDIRVYYYFTYMAWVIYLYDYGNTVCVKFVVPTSQNFTRSKYFVNVD
jgi:hypothetical protein